VEVVLDGALFIEKENEKDDSGNIQTIEKTVRQIGKYLLLSDVSG
jgi:hypothetical protein